MAMAAEKLLYIQTQVANADLQRQFEHTQASNDQFNVQAQGLLADFTSVSSQLRRRTLSSQLEQGSLRTESDRPRSLPWPDYCARGKGLESHAGDGFSCVE